MRFVPVTPISSSPDWSICAISVRNRTQLSNAIRGYAADRFPSRQVDAHIFRCIAFKLMDVPVVARAVRGPRSIW